MRRGAWRATSAGRVGEVAEHEPTVPRSTRVRERVRRLLEVSDGLDAGHVREGEMRSVELSVASQRVARSSAAVASSYLCEKWRRASTSGTRVATRAAAGGDPGCATATSRSSTPSPRERRPGGMKVRQDVELDVGSAIFFTSRILVEFELRQIELPQHRLRRLIERRARGEPFARSGSGRRRPSRHRSSRNLRCDRRRQGFAGAFRNACG